jgi:hypothetical protein
MTTTNTYGDLHDYSTGEYLRPATKAELTKSLEAAFDGSGEGVFKLDGRAVYVEGESHEAHRACGGNGHAE